MRERVLPMSRLITERIKELRLEIAKLAEANQKYLVGPKYGSATADNERRLTKVDRNRRRIEKPHRLEKAMSPYLAMLQSGYPGNRNGYSPQHPETMMVPYGTTRRILSTTTLTPLTCQASRTAAAR